MKNLTLLIVGAIALGIGGCSNYAMSSDGAEKKASEDNLREMTAQVGFPSITKFQEKRLLKEIYELRDREDLLTYTYTISEQTGKLRFLTRSLGYGIPASTQYSNPEKMIYTDFSMPQAEPNGLFPPSSADATWVIALDEKGNRHVIYVEPKVVVSPVKLPSN